MTTPNITVISRSAILVLTLSSMLFAAGCATEPDANSTPPSASPSPSNPTVTAPATTPSPAQSPAEKPAASPSATPKAKETKSDVK